MTETTIQLPKQRIGVIERLARVIGSTTTRCPYCGEWDARPSTHLDRKHPAPTATPKYGSDWPR